MTDARFPGQWNQLESGLAYNWHRHYDPTTGRYTQADPIGLAAGPSLYAYANGNPVNFIDFDGRWAIVDDAVFTVGGALVGVASQGGADLLAGQWSGWEDYVGAGIGGAASGETLLYAGPVAAGAVGGLATNVSKQLLKNLTGKQCGYNFTSVAVDTSIGGLAGFIPGVRINGITSGRGNWNSIYKQIATKFRNNAISKVGLRTALKMAGGRAVDTAVLPGATAGVIAGKYVAPHVPSY